MSIIGHKKIVEFLESNIKNEKVSHSYLFIGPPNVGKFRAAIEFAGKLCGLSLSGNTNIHPDIIVIHGDDSDEEIKIGQIRELKYSLSLSPYQLKCKIAVVNSVDRLTTEAANALLKTLEEPTASSILILIGAEIKNILPTIISRCQVVRFYPVPEKTLLEGLRAVHGNTSFVEEIVKLSMGRPGLALQMLEYKALYKKKQKNLKDLKAILSSDLAGRFEWAKKVSSEEGSNFLDEWLFYFRQELLCKLNIADHSFIDSQLSVSHLHGIIRNITRTRKITESTNVNTLLAIENLLLNI